MVVKSRGMGDSEIGSGGNRIGRERKGCGMEDRTWMQVPVRAWNTCRLSGAFKRYEAVELIRDMSAVQQVEQVKI